MIQVPFGYVYRVTIIAMSALEKPLMAMSFSFQKKTKKEEKKAEKDKQKTHALSVPVKVFAAHNAVPVRSRVGNAHDPFGRLVRVEPGVDDRAGLV